MDPSLLSKLCKDTLCTDIYKKHSDFSGEEEVQKRQIVTNSILVLYTFETLTLSDECFANISYRFVACSFVFIIVPFKVQKTTILRKSNLVLKLFKNSYSLCPKTF